MDAQRLYEIIEESTRVFRKGELVEESHLGNVDIIQVFGYDHTSTSPSGENFDKVDMVFVDVVVDRARAEKHRSTLAELLRDYPDPARLSGGPSYIELAPNLGMEQEGALRLMAMGKTLGMWDIVSGKSIKADEAKTLEMAGRGFLMISGYKPSK